MAQKGDITEHFSRAEFRDRRTGMSHVDVTLVDHLERLRTIVGQPLNIVSGYRSPTTNAAVGGAQESQHLKGWAADIPEGYATVDQALRAGFTGIGSKGKWAVHVDVRDTPTVERWTY
jgi:uncharacterized protein YcbK (DUF882 family)